MFVPQARPLLQTTETTGACSLLMTMAHSTNHDFVTDFRIHRQNLDVGKKNQPNQPPKLDSLTLRIASSVDDVAPYKVVPPQLAMEFNPIN